MRRENRVIFAIILLLVGLITAALFKPPAQSGPEGDGTDVATVIAKTPSYDETTPHVKPAPIQVRPLTRQAMQQRDAALKRMVSGSATTRVEKEKSTRSVSRTITTNDLVPKLPDRFPSPQKPLRPEYPKRIHTVVDGDTLRSLASRYLDDEKRWLEIYEANRSALDDPTSLPIGAKLTIPPQTADLGPQHASRSPLLSTVPQHQASRVSSRSASYPTPPSPVVRKVAKPIEKTLKTLPSEPMVPIKP